MDLENVIYKLQRYLQNRINHSLVKGIDKFIIEDIEEARLKSKKPIEVRMGKGKGSPEFYACRVKPGRILFEVDGVSEQIAKEALYKASAKLPIKTKTIKRFA